MARLIDQLSALKVAKVKAPGWYIDGGGLYLQVTGDGQTRINKSWIYQYYFRGKKRQMGLGSVTIVSLADAREKAKAAKRLQLGGKDPITVRDAARLEQKLEDAKLLTFKHCAERYIASHRAAWKSDKHAVQWQRTMEAYVYPHIGALPVQAVETVQVMEVLEPIWSTKTETAVRVRGRIEVVLGWAKVRGQRTGDNPARWKDHLDKLLPKPSKLRKVQHHPALPYAEMASFMTKLRRQEGTAARALEYTILTIARTTETLKSEWAEIDATENIWTIPAGRMKGDREHRVPLSAPALTVLELADLDAGEYNSAPTGEWTRGLLIRRNIADGDLAFFSTWCSKGMPMKKLVLVEGHRWAIEHSFETAKNELGLDHNHNESRSWHGWHRHVSLVMLAFSMMAIIRQRANAAPLKKTLPRLQTKHRS